MKHNPKYIFKHLSIRVPWHDNGWNGSVCSNPKANGACLILKNCALNRDDEQEESVKRLLLKDLEEDQFPVCVGERATFMASFNFCKTLQHPYAESSPNTHGHLKPSRVQFPAFSAAAVPYNWMLKEKAKEKTVSFDLNVDYNREPVLDWASSGNDTWAQEITIQKALLNCFFEHVEAETSLVFLYAKQTPFVEESGRVLVGVSKINKMIESLSLNPNLTVITDTVHGFQGDECDMVYFIVNPPYYSISPSSYGAFIHKHSLINVAISRAKDYLIILYPDNETKDIENLEKINMSKNGSIEQILNIKMGLSLNDITIHSSDIEEKILKKKGFIQENSRTNKHQLVNIYNLAEKPYNS